MLTREMQIGNLSSNPDKVPETLKKAECTINDTLRLATFPKFRPDRNILIGQSPVRLADRTSNTQEKKKKRKEKKTDEPCSCIGKVRK